ncbi:TadE/TadG family type IV pilus assembly protein [Thalassovita gelatinovora]|nr:TadE/TadG family type IV pilus assembly protein [Thalassovita gelatinovora]QIZ79189.1 pilus assembly protein [Thalassovita gelatinovora]
MRAFLHRFGRETNGSSVVEFALLAPIMLLMTLATFDVGKSISDRMAMDAALRNGLQVAMMTGSIDDTLEMMETTAESGLGTDQASFQVTQFCTCGTVSASQVSCTNICNGTDPTSVFLKLDGQFHHNGWLMPNIQFTPTLFLQQR